MLNSSYEITEELLNLAQESNDKDKREVIVKYSGDLEKIEKELGIKIEILDENYAIITLSPNQICLLHNYTEIQYIEIPKIVSYILRQELNSVCIPTLQNSNYNLTGKGTIIALIDSGIDYTHPDFRNSDGTSRIIYIWDQEGTGIPPEEFENGVEYNNEELNRALSTDQPYNIIPRMDIVGHGTTVIGVAAGNGRASNGREIGIAPEASIIVVKLGQTGQESFARTTEIMRAIKYVINKAKKLNMPIAINISFGTNNGAHSGNSLFETYIDDMSQKWKTAIIVASGNEGSAGHHFEGVVGTNQTIDIDFRVLANLKSLYITFWKNFVDTFELELIAPNGKSSGSISATTNFYNINISGTTVYIYNRQPVHYNEEQEIFFIFNMEDPYSAEGLWRIRVRGVDVVDGRFNAWLPTTEEVSINTSFLIPSVNTTLTLPSTARRVITVGGYNSTINSFAEFSGRGYTRNDVYVKPDLVAPAIGVLTTRMGGGYDSYSGTSIAAPFVTGACALMMEWGIVNGNDSLLYGQRIKAFLKKGARREQDRVYPNPLWGYGTLCIKDTIDYLVYYTQGGTII